MKNVKEQTTLAGVKKAVQSLSDCHNARLSKLEDISTKIKKQIICGHRYLRVEIEKDGWIVSWQATCSDCGKRFELGNGWMFKRVIKKIHKTFLKRK